VWAKAKTTASGDVVLRLAQAIWDTEAEGPGRRVALWLQGCPMRCPGCCNPEMQRFHGGTRWRLEALSERVCATADIEGITLLGGEPFSQALGCAALAAKARAAGLTVIVFTGYTLDTLSRRAEDGEADVGALLAETDLLVDGPYIAAQPERARRWVGSANQQMHFLSESYSADDPRFVTANTLELRLGADSGLTINGWPGSADQVLER